MAKLPNLVNQRFGHLIVLKLSDKKYINKGKGISLYTCKCDCGNQCDVRPAFLLSGHTKTCGHCNFYEDCGTHIKCTVKNGRSFVFDKEDEDIVRQFTWSIDKYGYVSAERKDGTKRKLKLHRLLTNAPKGRVVDHINGNASDNRQSNLRIASQHHNSFNSKMHKNNTTGFKGVCFDKKEGRYMAYIHPRRFKFLGYFDSPIDAAKAYDKAAKYYFGDFARLNFREEAS